MVTREKKSKRRTAHPHRERLLLWILMAILVVLTSFWAFVSWFSIQRYFGQWEVPPVQVMIYAPQYLSANEDAEIRFAVANVQNRDVNVTFQLMNSGPSIAFLGLEESNVFYSGLVPSQKQINRQIIIFFPLDVRILGKAAGLSLWGSIDNIPPEKVADLPIGIAPIPWAKSLGNYLGALLAGLTVWLMKELWNQIKEPVTQAKR